MLERNNPKPLYQQLRDILVDEIESGTWAVNERIPSENKLSEIYGLSRMTVRSVISDLVKEGVLYRVQGKGTFVAEKIVAVSPSYIGIREQLEKMGYEVKTKIIECKTVPCQNTVAKKLNLEVGAPVFMVKRMRYIKGGPISLHISYVNAEYSERLTEEKLEKEQLCVLLNGEYGVVRKVVSETLESILASEGEAELMEVEKGHPLILLRDILYDQNDNPYEYTKVVFRGDKIKVNLTYK
ncbi:MAG: GntR family transcriptional regulator [Lachnospiraceae bacterium]